MRFFIVVLSIITCLMPWRMALAHASTPDAGMHHVDGARGIDTCAFGGRNGSHPAV